MKQGQTILETAMGNTNAKYFSEGLINDARGPSFIAEVEPEVYEIRESVGKANALEDILE